MPKKIPAFMLLAVLGAAAGFSSVAPNPAHAKASDPVVCKDLKVKAVQDKCNGGANTEGKMRDVMKKWQEDAVAKGWMKGEKAKCTDCHKKASGGELNSDGMDRWKEFAKLLGL